MEVRRAMSGAGTAADVALLRAALDSLAEAVTIHDADGRLVYLNDAAVGVMGASSAEEALAMEPGGWISQWDVFREDGTRVEPHDLPGRRAFAGETPAPLIVRSVERETGMASWVRISSTPLVDENGHVTAAVNVLSDVTAVKNAEMAQRILADAGDILSSTMDLEQTLEGVARLAIPGLADWCAVDLVDEHGHVGVVAIAHADPAKIEFARLLRERYPPDLGSSAGIGAVLRTGVPEHVRSISDEELVTSARDDEHLAMIRSIGLRSILILPLGPRDDPIGTLTLVTSEQERAFGESDIALARELARRATTAIENARLYSEHAAIAHTLQEGLLPPALRPPPGYDVAVLFRPAGAANEVGGDFYDIVRLQSSWLAFVGDVAGKGALAASVTARTRYTLAAVTQLGTDADHALRLLNAALLDLPDRPMCTACCVALQAPGGSASVTCAGHPPPILVTADGAATIECRGPMVGAAPSSTWDATDVEIGPGEALVLYTDGVTDAVGAHDRFGIDRLVGALAGGPAATADAIVGRIATALDEFRAGPDRDDIAVLVLRRA
jgi:PAS domain S-box-containing protein